MFSSEKLGKAYQKEVYELRSCYFENDGAGIFKLKPLPEIAQASTVQAIISEDYNNDGHKDLFMVGNNYEINTQLGRMDALHGLILRNDRNGNFIWDGNQNFYVPGPGRTIQKIKIRDLNYYVVGINNNTPVFLLKQ